MSEFVRESTVDGVATVLMDRPELHNAFNETFIAEVTAAFDELGKTNEVRVIVLKGEGKSFCAGADVHWMRRMVGYSFEENVADAKTMSRMLRVIRECPKPVIARVQGAAIGGGVGLVAACDIAVAVESSVFGLTEVKLGIVPAVISPFVMEKIGMSAARRYALTAERFNAAEAMRIGLVSQIVGLETELDEVIGRICDAIKGNGPQAVSVAKELLLHVYAADLDRVEKYTTELIAERRVSGEGQDGLNAFLEKRKPGWVDG